MGNVWKQVIDADLAKAEGGGGQLPDGIYEAAVQAVSLKKFNSGSKGLEITYLIESGEQKGKSIRDYIVVEKADGTAIPSGPAKVKKFLMSAGLTASEMKTFKYPVDEEGNPTGQMGDFKKTLDAPFTIHVKARVNKGGPNNGQSFARVNTFKGRDELI